MPALARGAQPKRADRRSAPSDRRRPL